MRHLDGAGLAAPQIGVGLRVVIFSVDGNPRYPDAEQVPRTVLINPGLTPLAPTIEEGWEGCLSVPGLRGWVPRWSHLRYTGCDAFGRAIDRRVAGFHARVVQHECDHLDGVLYPMRIRDFRASSIRCGSGTSAASVLSTSFFQEVVPVPLNSSGLPVRQGCAPTWPEPRGIDLC